MRRIFYSLLSICLCLIFLTSCRTTPEKGEIEAEEVIVEVPSEPIEISTPTEPQKTTPPLKIIPYPSPNYSKRTLQVDTILLHYTAIDSVESSLRHLANARIKSRVSAHYVVGTDGAIYRLVDEKYRAWHAGEAYWRGVRNVNSSSIGIEIVNAGIDKKGNRPPYPEAQIAAVIALCKDIQSRHKIKWVLGHSDVAPGRKQDPGEHFPWKRLAAEGVGVWTDGFAEPTGTAKEMLEKIGYDTKDIPKSLTAFYRHFYPEVMTTGGTNTLRRLSAVTELFQNAGR